MEEQKQLGIFNFNNNITIIGDSENPWFIVKEIAEILGITSYRNFISNLEKKNLIYIDIIFFRKETIYIKIIQLSFSHIISYTEYMFGNYRVDLLFPDKKLVVECDEFNHTKYNKEDELERERYIRSEGYNFVRFNPDETDFNIGKVINQIMKKVYDI